MSGVAGPTGPSIDTNYSYGVEFQKKYANELSWANTVLGAGEFDPATLASDFAVVTGLPAPKITDMGDLMTMVQALRQKSEEQNLDVSTNRVQNIKAKQADQAEERLEKLTEQFKKMDEAQKAGGFQKAFGYIAAAFMLLAGAILCATGVGAAAGAALIAGGATMLTMQLLQEDFGNKGKSAMNLMVEGLATMMAGPDASPEEKEKAKMHATAIICGILSAVAAVAGTIAGGPMLGLALVTQTMGPLFTPDNLKAMGVKEEDAGYASLGINIGMAIIGIGAAAGGAKAVSKAVELGPKAAQLAGGLAGKATYAASQTASGAAEVVKAGSKTTEIAGKIFGYGSGAMSGVATVGQGTATIAGAAFTKDANKARADLADIQANQQLLARHMEEMQEELEAIIRRLEEGMQIVMGVLNQVGMVGTNVARINV